MIFRVNLVYEGFLVSQVQLERRDYLGNGVEMVNLDRREIRYKCYNSVFVGTL